MKKLLIALLIVISVVFVAVVGAGYYVYRQVRSTVVQFAELGQLPDIERGIRVKAPFVPPASEELTESQVARFMRVQGHVRHRLGERAVEFERKYKALADKKEATLRDAPALVAAYRDMVAAWLDAKRSQVEALNEASLSLEEYRWIRHQAYRALGLAYVDLDMARLTEEASRGGSGIEPAQLRGAFGADGPETNRKLVEGFKKQLEANLALASFGL